MQLDYRGLAKFFLMLSSWSFDLKWIHHGEGCWHPTGQEVLAFLWLYFLLVCVTDWAFPAVVSSTCRWPSTVHTPCAQVRLRGVMQKVRLTSRVAEQHAATPCYCTNESKLAWKSQEKSDSKRPLLSSENPRWCWIWAMSPESLLAD